MEYQIVSQFINDRYSKRTLLLPHVTERRIPRLGTVVYDQHASFRPIRPYLAVELSFPAVFARHIAEPILSDEFVVHDGRHIYVDSSIHTAGSPEAQIPQVADRLVRTLGSCTDPPSDEYRDQSALVMHNEGGGTWGHFLVQNFPRALLYLRHFPHGRIVVPHAHTERLNNNFARLFTMFGIPPEVLLPVKRQRSYRFRELILVDFLFDFAAQAVHPAVLELLQPAGPWSRRAPGRRVYIERISGQNSRTIENAGNVRPILTRHGFETRTLGLRPVQHQAAWWRSSELVTATLGSDLANIVFGEPGARLLVLSPDWFGDSFFYQLAVAKQMQWNELRCGQRGEAAQTDPGTGFRVDEALLDSMLDSLVRG